MKDAYEKFAYDYDEFGEINEYLENEKSFFQAIFEKYNVNTVLDCACGTGQHLYMFSEMSLSVNGSDFSDAMIKVANKNLRKFGKNISLCQCDFRFLEKKYEKTFDAVVCLTNSLPHLHSDDDLITTLKSMKNRLNKNGLLILTQGTTHYSLSLPSIEVVINRENFSRIFVKEHDDKLQTIHILDLFHSKNRMENNQYEIVYRILLDNDYRKLLKKAGFENYQIFGDYSMNAYDEKSMRLIGVAINT
jgi:ubiquinone/menaquinone biosynthesis C-methylase UbiE